MATLGLFKTPPLALPFPLRGPGRAVPPARPTLGPNVEMGSERGQGSSGRPPPNSLGKPPCPQPVCPAGQLCTRSPRVRPGAPGSPGEVCTP